MADFIEASCAVPDGDLVGEPFKLTDEQLRFLLFFYRLEPATETDGRGRYIRPFTYFRGGQLVRPQKWGKGPLAAAMACAEAQGPVVFDGWDASGEPVGRPWSTPLIQVTAVSEDQTANVFRALVPMIELGDLVADIPDTGETRINLPGGGRIEPVTASARSRLGQRLTFAIQDQGESWTEHNGGRRLADNQRRNLAGMKGRFLETDNAWDPLDESVAQQTAEGGEPGIYLDDVEPGPGSIRNKRERRHMLRKVYGDSWWVDLDRIEGEIEALLARDPQQAERWFLNRKLASEDAAFDFERFKALASDVSIAEQSLITIGIDGARTDDALAVVACDIEAGHLFPIGIWEVPSHAPPDYEHPFGEVDGALSDAFDNYQVWRVYIDSGSQTGNIVPLMERWAGRWGDRILDWKMNRPTPVAHAVRNFTTAINMGDLTHDGDVTLQTHIRNARRQKLNVKDDDGRQMWTISKDRPGSPRKIDGAAAAVLAWEARGDAIEAGAEKHSNVAAFF